MKPIESYRDFFPAAKNVAYLNHAGVAPISSPVADAIRKTADECLEWGAVRYANFFKTAGRTREKAAKFMSVSGDDIAFVKNTSEGISFVAQGFDWREGDRVVVPEGEFPANVYPWMNLKSYGVEVVRVPLKGGRLLIDDYREALSLPGVRMLAVSAVEYETGFANDLAALGQLCWEKDIFFFVDAIQKLGWSTIEPEEFGIDALAADGHKWLLAPEGIGVFYISEKARELIHPVEVGWNSVEDAFTFEVEDFTFRKTAIKYEPGSYPMVLIHGLEAAFDLLLEAGIERIEKRALSLASTVEEGLQRRGYELLSPRGEKERSPIVSFLPKGEPEALWQALLDRGVFTAARGRGLRVSSHFYNNDVDIEKFFKVMDELEG